MLQLSEEGSLKLRVCTEAVPQTTGSSVTTATPETKVRYCLPQPVRGGGQQPRAGALEITGGFKSTEEVRASMSNFL